MLYTTYDADGRITGNGGCPDGELAAQAALQGAAGAIEGSWSWSTHRIDLSGETPTAVLLPARPSEHHVFDFVECEWIDPRTMADRRAAKWVELKAARDAAEFGPFEWDQSTFDGDAGSQSRIMGAAQLATLAIGSGSAFAQEWTLADNTVRTLSAEDMLAVGIAMGAHIRAAHARGRELRALLDACTTSAEVDAIFW